jgi:hypothetical protein
LSFENNALGNYVIQEHTVMRDKEYRALIITQQIFEQLLSVDVQVVGRFVQDQYIGRTGEEFCQQKAVAFAA